MYVSIIDWSMNKYDDNYDVFIVDEVIVEYIPYVIWLNVEWY